MTAFLHRFTFRLILSALAVFVLTQCKNRNSGGNDWGPGGPGGAGYGNGDQVVISPLGERPNGASLYGPGSGQVDRSRFTPVYFAFDSSQISPAEAPKIQQVASFLRSNRSLLILGGHTDSIGTSEYNRNLGERRALAVRSALLAQGVPPGQVQTVSYGEDMPAGGSDALNRRVEFGVTR